MINLWDKENISVITISIWYKGNNSVVTINL